MFSRKKPATAQEMVDALNELPDWPCCPTCDGLVSPSRYADMERQDGSLGELWRAGFAHGIVVGAAIATFAGGAALLVWGVL